MTLTANQTAGPTRTGSGADGLAVLADRLADPAVANSLASLLQHADLLAVLVEGLDQFLARGEVIGESLLGSIDDLRVTVDAGADGIDLDEVVRSATSLASVLPKAAPGMVSAVESGAIDRLLASDLVTPQALNQVEVIARGLTRGSATHEAGEGVEIRGVLSLAKLLKDPDIAHALGYFATVAKTIGAELKSHQAR